MKIKSDYNYILFFIASIFLGSCNDADKNHLEGINEIRGDLNDNDKTTRSPIELEQVMIKISKDLTKKEVYLVAGAPLNNSEEDVWIWSWNNPIGTETDWKSISEEIGTSGYFVVFENGLSLSYPRPLGQSRPQYIYAKYKNIALQDVPNKFVLPDN